MRAARLFGGLRDNTSPVRAAETWVTSQWQLLNTPAPKSLSPLKVYEDGWGGGVRRCIAIFFKRSLLSPWWFCTIIVFHTLGLVISVAATSPHDIHGNPISLYAAESKTFMQNVIQWTLFLNVLIASSCQGLVIFPDSQLFFFQYLMSGTVKASLIPSHAQACWWQYCSPSLLPPLCRRHVFKLYVCRSHPSNMAFTGQTELSASDIQWRVCHPAAHFMAEEMRCPPHIRLIEVPVEALPWFINAAAQVPALTTAGGSVLLCDTKSFVDNVVCSLNAFG